MNTKRIIFWICFLIVLVLIIWGLIVAMNKPAVSAYGAPAPVTAADHARGPADAKATLIEYSDFQCPACENFYPYVEQAFNESSSSLRTVYRHFPLSQHANAVPSALASEAAGAQGKFWEMYKMLFDNHADWTELADPTSVFVGYAGKLGLDVTKFQADLSNPDLKAIITAESDEGVKIGINSTPTFFLNGKIMTPQSYDDFMATVKAAATGSAAAPAAAPASN